MYEIFFVSSTPETDVNYLKIKSKYPRAAKIKNVDNFENIRKASFTKMFWVIWDDCILDDSFDLDIEIPEYDQTYIHTWKNGDFFDGIALFPRNRKISSREFRSRFYLTDKKESSIIASYPRPYDIVFISYNESNADENYARLIERFPRAKHVHGVKGIHKAHIEAAKISTTDMFWVVDADAHIVDDFNFDYYIPYFDFYNKATVYVWRSRNPINNLEYGNGGVKLLPRKLTLEVDVDSIDMTTSISRQFRAMEDISNINMFNVDPFNTWKSAFRECAKLSSKTIKGQIDEETNQRLEIWTTVGADKTYGNFAIAGAKLGRDYGLDPNNDISLINDFDWLKMMYESQR